MDHATSRTMGQIIDRYRATTLQLSRTEEMLKRAREVEEYGCADGLRHLFRETRWCSQPIEGTIIATGRGVGADGSLADDIDATGIDYLYVVRRRAYSPSAWTLAARSGIEASLHHAYTTDEDAARTMLDRHVEAYVLKRDLRVGARRLPRTKPFGVVGACYLDAGIWDAERVFSRDPMSDPVRIATLHPAARQFLGIQE